MSSHFTAAPLTRVYTLARSFVDSRMPGGVAENIMTSKNLLIGMCTYGVVPYCVGSSKIVAV